MMLMSGFARWNPPGTPSRDSRRAARCRDNAPREYSRLLRLFTPFPLSIFLFFIRLLIRPLDLRNSCNNLFRFTLFRTWIILRVIRVIVVGVFRSNIDEGKKEKIIILQRRVDILCAGKNNSRGIDASFIFRYFNLRLRKIEARIKRMISIYRSIYFFFKKSINVRKKIKIFSRDVYISLDWMSVSGKSNSTRQIKVGGVDGDTRNAARVVARDPRIDPPKGILYPFIPSVSRCPCFLSRAISRFLRRFAN